MRVFILLFAWIVFSCNVWAKDNQATEFEKAYTLFNISAKSGDWEAALSASKKAHKLGLKIYGKRHINAAMLNYNYGLSLFQNQKFSKAKTFLKRSLMIYRQQYGEESIKLVPILMDVGRLTLRGPRGKRNTVYFNQALELISKHYGKNSVEYGELLFKTANIVENRYFLEDSYKYYLKAYKTFKLQGESSYIKLAMAAYHLGVHQFYSNDIKTSIKYFELVVEKLKAEENNTDYVLTKSHSYLEKCYKIRNNPEKQLLHSNALKNTKPEFPDQNPIVIYMDTPRIPTKSAWKDSTGEVTFQFNITTDGVAENIEVQDKKAPDKYVEYAKNVLEEARFLPLYENGKAKKYKGLTHTFFFDVEREVRRIEWKFNMLGGELRITSKGNKSPLNSLKR